MTERILQLRAEIESLERIRRQIQYEINEKNRALEALEILTENQLNLFENESEKS